MASVSTYRPLLRRILFLLLLLPGLTVWGHLTLTFRHGSSDLIQDYAAATALRSGLSIYGESIARIADTLIPPGSVRLENFHPPFTALLSLPLSRLSYPDAFTALGVITLLLWVGMIIAVTRRYTLSTTLILPLLLLWYPFLYATGTGNISMVIAAGVTFGILLAEGRPFTGGALLGLTAAIKLFPALLLVGPALERRWRVCAGGVCALVVAFALTLLLVPWADVHGYAAHIAARNVEEWSSFIPNMSITGLVLPLVTVNDWIHPLLALPIDCAVRLTTALSFGAIFLTLFIALRRSITGTQLLALLAVTMLLASPITWMHIYPVLIVPVALLYRSDLSHAERGALLIAILCCSLPDVFIAREMSASWAGVGIPRPLFILVKLPIGGLLILWVLLITPRPTTCDRHHAG